MDDPTALRPAREREGVAVPVADVPSWSLSRRLYEEIGREHHWLDRLVWDEARWRRHVEGVETLLPSVRGTPAGRSTCTSSGSCRRSRARASAAWP
jgi:hypothetical protein